MKTVRKHERDKFHFPQIYKLPPSTYRTTVFFFFFPKCIIQRITLHLYFEKKMIALTIQLAHLAKCSFVLYKARCVWRCQIKSYFTMSQINNYEEYFLQLHPSSNYVTQSAIHLEAKHK